ncbi:hypothetical protein R1sor_022782 [Riccia sorocarpa]|uniref:Uncharacterized protein n=1 Tax=Riccia sorocarpa TaxID=122646 RepID=A0ABD3GPR6_9MARC
MNIPEADALVPDDLISIQQQKQQRRTSNLDGRSKASDPVFPQVLTSAEKEECQNIELMIVENSSLVKLKRKIPLRLLAEETRNSATIYEQLQRGRKPRKQLSFQPSPSRKHTREMETLPQAGRRSSIPASVINGLTASNKKLIKFVQELMSSAASSFSKSLLESSSVENPAYDNSEEEPEDPPKDTSHQENDSEGISDDSRRKRKDTTIPFETPKTTYELERDNILRRQKDQFGRLGILSELIEEPQPCRPTRPYCRRWASEPDPAYQRNTRWASEPDPAYQRNTRLKDLKRKSSAQQADTALKDNIEQLNC